MASSEETEPPPTLSRRQCLPRIAIAALALGQQNHDSAPRAENLPRRKTIIAPQNEGAQLRRHYEKAYHILNAAVTPAANELSEFAGKFGVFDTVKLLQGFEVTLLPPQGSQEGQCQWRMRARDKRTGELPALCNLLKACQDIKHLDERNNASPQDRLDVANVAGQVVAHFKSMNPRSFVNAETMHQDCAAVFTQILGAADVFEPGPQMCKDEAIKLELKISQTIPLDVVIKNPYLRQNRYLAERVIVHSNGR